MISLCFSSKADINRSLIYMIYMICMGNRYIHIDHIDDVAREPDDLDDLLVSYY